LETQTRRAHARAKQNIEVPQGVGKEPKRVAEGKQGKYGGNGVLRRPLSEGLKASRMPAQPDGNGTICARSSHFQLQTQRECHADETASMPKHTGR
jgi:hypothetical protein